MKKGSHNNSLKLLVHYLTQFFMDVSFSFYPIMKANLQMVTLSSYLMWMHIKSVSKKNTERVLAEGEWFPCVF